MPARSRGRCSPRSLVTCARTWSKTDWPRASAWPSSSTSGAWPRATRWRTRCWFGRVTCGPSTWDDDWLVPRVLVPGSDVFDERNYKRGARRGARLDGLGTGRRRRGAGSSGWAESTANNPAKKLASAVDLERWLGRLGPEDRMMLALRHGRSHARAASARRWAGRRAASSSRLRQLGEQLAEVAEVEIRDRRAA